MSGLSFTTAELAEEFELVASNRLATLAVVTIKPDIHFFSWVVLIFKETNFTYCFCGSQKLYKSSGCAQLQFVVLRHNFLGSFENVHTSAAAEQGYIPKFAWHNWMVHEVCLIFRCKLCP